MRVNQIRGWTSIGYIPFYAMGQIEKMSVIIGNLNCLTEK